MNDNSRADVLTELAGRLETVSASVNRLVTSDDAEISYAATTAALHLHAAQADLVVPPPFDAIRPAPEHTPGLGQTAEALQSLGTWLTDAPASLPAGQQATTARVALHIAEARDVLKGAGS